MNERINIASLEPKSFEVLLQMEKYIASTGLDHKLKELIKIRASQINKCAYCLEMHTEDARKGGETEQRIYALSAWEESPYFTGAERATLALTEEVTKLSEHGVKGNTFQDMRKYFTDHQIAQIIIVIGQINFWNRINVSTKQLFHP